MALITNFLKGNRVCLPLEAVGGYYDPLNTLYDNDDLPKSNTGVLLNISGGAEIKFTAASNIIIYAISNTYSDNGGSSGKNLNIYRKTSADNYELYQTVPTQGGNNGWYELCKLKAGSYWFKAAARYVTFTEWYIVYDALHFIKIGDTRYSVIDDNISVITDDKILSNTATDLDTLSSNLIKILTLVKSEKFRVEVLKDI